MYLSHECFSQGMCISAVKRKGKDSCQAAVHLPCLHLRVTENKHQILNTVVRQPVVQDVSVFCVCHHDQEQDRERKMHISKCYIISLAWIPFTEIYFEVTMTAALLDVVYFEKCFYFCFLYFVFTQKKAWLIIFSLFADPFEENNKDRMLTKFEDFGFYSTKNKHTLLTLWMHTLAFCTLSWRGIFWKRR